MTPTTIALALLVFALVVTRLWEEARWRDGTFSDRTSAILVVGRLPFLVAGFGLIVGLDLVAVAGATLVAGLVAAGLYVPVVRRLRRLSAERGRPTAPR